MRKTAEQNDWPYDFGLVDIEGSRGSSVAVLRPARAEPEDYYSPWFPRHGSEIPPLEFAGVGETVGDYIRLRWDHRHGLEVV